MTGRENGDLSSHQKNINKKTRKLQNHRAHTSTRSGGAESHFADSPHPAFACAKPTLTQTACSDRTATQSAHTPGAQTELPVSTPVLDSGLSAAHSTQRSLRLHLLLLFLLLLLLLLPHRALFLSPPPPVSTSKLSSLCPPLL